jgi:protein-glutamine gamma-glutamyltransferase
MSTPPFLAGAALAFWGWQTGNLLVALPIAAALEAPRWLRMRFALEPADYARVSDLCTVFFVLLAIALAVDRGVAQGLATTFRWMPVVLAPILLVQRLGEGNRVPLTALFRHLRKQKARDPSVHVPMLDTGGPFVALCVIAAGLGNAGTRGYFAGAVLLAAWALLAARPRHARPAAWALVFAAATGLGYAGGAGLAALQSWVGGLIAEWHLQRASFDPGRNITDIGTLGRLKQRDAILARVYGAPNDVRRARLLHRGSYNAYIGTSWLARRAPSATLEPEPGGISWRLAPGAGEATIGIAARVERRRTALSLPPGVTRLVGLSAGDVVHNGLGVVQAAVSGDWVRFDAEFGDTIAHYEPPLEEDRAVPPSERAAFTRLARELALEGLAPQAAIERVMRHLAGFSYSLWQESRPPAGVSALEDFMTRTKSGHCEYFASAATILLRAAGVPARYATGFAVMEWSDLEEAWVVRTRHAHAWTRAWVDGRWIDLDPTPPDWFAEEQGRLAPLLESVLDFFRWASFRWSQRGSIEASDAWWGVLALLVAVLGWRLLRGKRLRRRDAAAATAARAYPGMDSEFYELVKALPPREAGETLSAWLARVAPGRYDEALRLHQRYRFDPMGLSNEERARLRELCRQSSVAVV